MSGVHAGCRGSRADRVGASWSTESGPQVQGWAAAQEQAGLGATRLVFLSFVRDGVGDDNDFRLGFRRRRWTDVGRKERGGRL